MEMNKITKTVMNDINYIRHMKDVSCQPFNDELVLDVQFKDSFTALSTIEQFAYLDAYCESIRKYINASKLTSEYGRVDIILTSSNLSDVYKYHNTCWNRSVYGVLYMNDEQVYCQKQYTIFKSNFNYSLVEEYFNGYSDLEIMKYTVNVYNLITYGGAIRTLDSDNDQIASEVTERFGITQEDFRKIYKKYYYQYH